MTDPRAALADYEKRALQIIKLASEQSDEIAALRNDLSAAPVPAGSDMDVLVEALHDGLGGNGWAYTNYGGDELNSKRSDLEDGVRAILAHLSGASAPVVERNRLIGIIRSAMIDNPSSGSFDVRSKLRSERAGMAADDIMKLMRAPTPRETVAETCPKCSKPFPCECVSYNESDGVSNAEREMGNLRNTSSHNLRQSDEPVSVRETENKEEKQTPTATLTALASEAQPGAWVTLDEAPLGETGFLWCPAMRQRTDITGAVHGEKGSRIGQSSMARGYEWTHWHPPIAAPQFPVQNAEGGK